MDITYLKLTNYLKDVINTIYLFFITRNNYYNNSISFFFYFLKLVIMHYKDDDYKVDSAITSEKKFTLHNFFLEVIHDALELYGV